jgi:hypothetical protein
MAPFVFYYSPLPLLLQHLSQGIASMPMPQEEVAQARMVTIAMDTAHVVVSLLRRLLLKSRCGMGEHCGSCQGCGGLGRPG